MMLVTFESTPNSWPPLTASLEAALTVPSATLLILVPLAPPSVMLPLVASSYLTASVSSADSWLKFTASVAAVPAATLVSLRLPAVPAMLISVPPVDAPTVIGDEVPPACCTRPNFPSMMLVTFESTPNSWLPLTASLEVALTVPSATLLILVPLAPPSVILPLVALSYLTASVSSADSWLKLTASVAAVPAATLVSLRLPAVPAMLISVPPVDAPTVMGALVPPIC